MNGIRGHASEVKRYAGAHNVEQMTYKHFTTERQLGRNELNQSAAQPAPNMFLQPDYVLQRDTYVTVDEETSESEEKVRSMYQCALDINRALERHNPRRTFDVLTPLVNLSFCRLSYCHQNQSEEQLQAIRSFFHEELHTAMKEKGSYLSYEEIVAALDVLSYVLRVNEVLEIEAAENILRLLISPEAYWEGVHNNRIMSEIYSTALKELRDSKRSTGGLPILTHAEIQNVIFACNRAHRFTDRQLKDPFEKAIYHPIPPAIRITEESKATASHIVSSKELSLKKIGRGHETANIDRLLFNMNQNSPLVTYELLTAIVHEYKLDVSLYKTEMAGVYHSFLLFAWRRWLACYTYMHGAASPTRQFPIETITKAVHRANCLIERMLLQGEAIARLNVALEQGESKQVADALWKPQMKLANILKIANLSTHSNKVDTNVPMEALQTAYCETLIRVRKERLVRSAGYPRGLGSFATTVCNVSPATAYLESICPRAIGSGWIWSHVPAFDHSTLGLQSEEEEFLLSRFKVPYFYNVHTKQLVIWPLTSSHPTMETVWTDDLTQLRWPVGVRDPPTLDSGLLNREDCVAIITQLNAEYCRKHHVFNETTSTVTQQDDVKAMKGCALHRLNKLDYPREFEKKRRLNGVLDEKFTLNTTAFNETANRHLNLCALRIQSNWRRYLVQQAYRRRLAYLHSSLSVNAVRCLQRNWRRTLVMRKLRNILSQHRRSVDLIAKVQAHWRGRQVRQWFRAFRLLMQNCADVGANEYGYDSQQSNIPMRRIMGNAEVMDFVSECVPFLSGHAAKKAFEMEMNCFLLGKSILFAIDKLIAINQELSSSNSLIKLLVQIRLSKQRKLALKERPNLPRVVGMDARTHMNKAETHNGNGRRMLIYGPLCCLLYSHPDYVVALLHCLPTDVLWTRDRKSPLLGPDSFKVSSYGLAFERLIFSLYRYGASPKDYVRLMHIFSRGIHQAVGDVLTDRSITNWYNEIRPWPFVLRMVVSFARMTLHRSGPQKKLIQSDDLELPLHKDKLQQLIILLVNSLQSASPEDEIFRAPGSSLRSCASMHTEPPAFTSQCVSQNNAHQGEDAESDATSSEELLSIDTNGLDLYRPPRLFLAIDTFLRGIFIDPGPGLLPDCLKYAIRELYRALRHAFPMDPEKTHLKFVGHALLHPYLHVAIVAPEIFHPSCSVHWMRSASRQEDRSLHSQQTSQSGSTKRDPITTKQRRSLAAVSRLLYCVIANKGYEQIGDHNSPHSRLTLVINALIHQWHVRFRDFILHIVDMNSPLISSRIDGNLISTWIGSTTGKHGIDISLGEPSKFDRRAGVDQPRLKSTRRHSVLITAGELFELHRLLLTHQYSIAPHRSDRLHLVLNRLGPLPVRTWTEHRKSSQADPISSTSEDDGSFGLKFSRTPASTTDLKAQFNSPSCAESSSSSVQTEHHNSQLFTDHDPTTFLTEPFIPVCDQYYLLMEPNDRQFFNHGQHLIPSWHQVTIPLSPGTPEDAMRGYLYAALAAPLTSVDCAILPLRPCHNCWTTDKKRTQCRLCHLERTNRSHYLIESLVVSDEESFDVSKNEHRYMQCDTSNSQMDSLEVDPKTRRNCSKFHWLEARKLLLLLLRQVTNTESPAQRKSIPLPEQFTNLHQWMRSVHIWLTAQSVKLESTGSSPAAKLRALHATRDELPDGYEGASKTVHDEVLMVSIKSTLNALQQLIQRLCYAQFLSETNGYNELVMALVKDVWHLRSPCQLYEWEQLAGKLKHVLAMIHAEIQTLDQQATIYAAHALDCLVPLDKSAQRTRDSWWKQKNQGHYGYRTVFQVPRLQKIGVIEPTSARPHKHQNIVELVLEPLYEVVDNVRPDDKLSLSESNIPAVSGLTRRFIPGMFELSVETPDMTLHRTTVSLVDLLCQQHQGMTTWSVSKSINIALGPFIQLILDTYYTTS